jgi:sporulation protein YlmC with PRC-barrel domain
MAVLNLSELRGKEVFTVNAKHVGRVEDIMLDTKKGNVYGLIVEMSKDSFLYKMFQKSEETTVKKTILVPHGEVRACDDIVLVSVPAEYERMQPAVEESVPGEVSEASVEA